MCEACYRADEPNMEAWSDFARFGYAVAKLRSAWWWSGGDLFWNLGLTVAWPYQQALRAERDAWLVVRRMCEFHGGTA